MESLENYLLQFGSRDWLASIEELLPTIHPVDREAVQIWFRFFPIDLKRYLDAAEDREAAINGLAILGNFELKDQIDTSHHFLYGHRYWKSVKDVVGEVEIDAGHELRELIDFVADQVANRENVGKNLTLAISAIGLATVAHVGIEAFSASTGEVQKPAGLMGKTPDQIVTERAKDDSQGLFGFLKTVNKTFSINFASLYSNGKFPIVHDQQVTHASAQAKSPEWQEMDRRCWEGPIPVECTSAACGTCWIGVVGGAEKLTPVQSRERRAMKVFGYNQPEGEKPFLRLACQTKASGNVSIVIPPWNGVFGKKVCGNVEEIELEPVTSSAKALRELIPSK
jgi:ferredoxin